MMKAGAIGQLYDVTELLQTQRRDSQWHMQEFVNGRAFPPFRGAHKDKGPEYYPMEFFCNQPRRSRRKNCRAAAVGKNATRRRVSRMILASVVNASRRRRRGL